jgi:hypothetical protein
METMKEASMKDLMNTKNALIVPFEHMHIYIYIITLVAIPNLLLCLKI